MSIDLSGLSAKALATLIAKAQQQQTKLTTRAPIAKVRSKIVKYAKSEGYSIEELFGAGEAPAATRGRKAAVAKKSPMAGRKLGKVAPKYRNPANTKETWTGRGKQPRWLAAYVASGKQPEDFLIKKK